MFFNDKQELSPHYIVLAERSAIHITGPDRFDFLQGLLTQDIHSINQGLSLWAALLTPQGRILHEMFISAQNDVIIIDCVADQRDSLHARLSRFRLRMQVEIVHAPSDWVISCFWGAIPLDKLELVKEINSQSCSVGYNSMIMIDPRHAAMGVRMIGPQKDISVVRDTIGALEAAHHDYHALRISLALPDGEHDLKYQPCFALEANMDGLKGIDFKKGCFIGQEVTARMRYRKLVKRRFIPFHIPSGTLLKSQAPVLNADKKVGHITSFAHEYVLAFMRLDCLHKPLQVCDSDLILALPDWLKPFLP